MIDDFIIDRDGVPLKKQQEIFNKRIEEGLLNLLI